MLNTTKCHIYQFFAKTGPEKISQSQHMIKNRSYITYPMTNCDYRDKGQHFGSSILRKSSK